MFCLFEIVKNVILIPNNYENSVNIHIIFHWITTMINTKNIKFTIQKPLRYNLFSMIKLLFFSSVKIPFTWL